ncbi:MAG: glycosyltransferase family 4 protein [Verrucomicrobiota bacterium]|jgi:glycosyltransferase involved in cell wall biosynthesis
MSTGAKPKILIVGAFTFSRGEAGSNYAIGLGKALKGTGFCIEYLSKDGDRARIREDFREFTCHSAPGRRFLTGWKSAISALSASDDGLIKWVEQAAAGEFSAVIAYPGADSTVGFLVRLHRSCLKKGFKLIVYVCEWQPLWRFGDPKLRRRLAATVDAEIQRRVVNKRINHVIAVSSFLERYYRKSGCDVIRIPPLIDAQAEKWHCRPAVEGRKQRLTLLFSGSWRRDRLDLITEAILRLRQEGHNVVLEFLGSGANDFERNPRIQSQMLQAPQGCFRFHGNVPVEKVLPITASADFGVLLRDRAKWSDACFPSKVAEFQALGVPLLCNLTSNLEEVLRDGDNALIVPQVSMAAFVATVKRALALAPAEMHHMKQCSLQCAANRFDYRIYSDPLGRFVLPLSAPGLLSNRASGPTQV